MSTESRFACLRPCMKHVCLMYCMCGSHVYARTCIYLYPGCITVMHMWRTIHECVYLSVCIFLFVCLPTQACMGGGFWLEDKRNFFFLTSMPHFLLPVVTDELLQLMHVKNRNSCMTDWQKTQHVIIDKQGRLEGYLTWWYVFSSKLNTRLRLAAYLTLEYKGYYRAKVPPNKTKLNSI